MQLGSLTVVCIVFALALATGSMPASAHKLDAAYARLTNIGPAPDFELVAQDGNRFSLRDLRGKIVAVSFTFTRCVDVCPILTAKMVGVQREFGSRFGKDLYFVTVSMDPEYDEPELLEQYAIALGCDLDGWTFLTGSEANVSRVARDYGVFRNKTAEGEIDHTLLTSIIDRSGNVRVQYMGTLFDSEEFVRDLRDLIDEEAEP